MAKRIVTYEVIDRKRFNALKQKVQGCLYLIKDSGCIVAMFYGSMPVRFLTYKEIKEAVEGGDDAPKIFLLSDSLLNGYDYLG